MPNFTPDLKGKTPKDILLKEVMYNSPATFNESTDIFSAMEKLIDFNLSGAPVIDKSGQLKGWLSEKDCLKFVLEAKYYNNPPESIGQFMSKNVVSLQASDSLFHAIDLFTRYHFQCYPITENDVVVGVVSRSQVLKAVGKIAQTTW